MRRTAAGTDIIRPAKHTRFFTGGYDGDPTAEDYGAVPYGKSHVLFSSNRDATALTPKDPETNKPLPSLYLMRLSDRKVTAYKGNEAINDLKYYVGPAALLPDSSAIIMNHSRQNLTVKEM